MGKIIPLDFKDAILIKIQFADKIQQLSDPQNLEDELLGSLIKLRQDVLNTLNDTESST